MFLKLRGGTATLTDRLAERLGPDVLRTSTRATAIEQPADGGFEVQTADGGRLPADAVIVATPAWAAADLLEGIAPPAAADLLDIPYASTAVVLLVYPEGTPLTNLHVTLLDKVGVPVDKLGDSTGKFSELLS